MSFFFFCNLDESAPNLARLSKSVMVCKMWGDAHTSCFRGQGALEGSSGSFSNLGNLLCHCPRRKTSHNISHDGPPRAPVWFPQSRQPSQSQPVQRLPLGWSCAKIDAAWDNNSESCSLSNMGWSSLKGLLPLPSPQTDEKLGFVQLETDRRGRLDHFFTAVGVGDGLLSGFVNSLMLPMCQEPPVPFNAILAADNSPRWTRFLARSALFSTLSVWCRRLREDTWWACSSLERLLSNTGHSGTIGLVPPTSSRWFVKHHPGQEHE